MGALFVSLVMPILEALGELFLSYIEAKKIKFGEEINNANIRIQMASLKAEEEQMPIETNVIGFHVPDEEEEEFYYEDE